MAVEGKEAAVESNTKEVQVRQVEQVEVGDTSVAEEGSTGVEVEAPFCRIW